MAKEVLRTDETSKVNAGANVMKNEAKSRQFENEITVLRRRQSLLNYYKPDEESYSVFTGLDSFYYFANIECSL